MAKEKEAIGYLVVSQNDVTLCSTKDDAIKAIKDELDTYNIDEDEIQVYEVSKVGSVTSNPVIKWDS